METLRTSTGLQLRTIKQFIEWYHPTLSAQSVKAAIFKGKIDYVQPERDIFIVLTDKTLSYTPKKYKDKR